MNSDLKKKSSSSVLLYVYRDYKDYYNIRRGDSHLDFHMLLNSESRKRKEKKKKKGQEKSTSFIHILIENQMKNLDENILHIFYMVYLVSLLQFLFNVMLHH